jgi:hypothetical protein
MDSEESSPDSRAPASQKSSLKMTTFGCLVALSLPFAIAAAFAGTCSAIEYTIHRGEPNQELLVVETACLVASGTIAILLLGVAFWNHKGAENAKRR